MTQEVLCGSFALSVHLSYHQSILTFKHHLLTSTADTCKPQRQDFFYHAFLDSRRLHCLDRTKKYAVPFQSFTLIEAHSDFVLQFNFSQVE